MNSLWRRLQWWLRRAEFERDLDEELRHHLSLSDAPPKLGNLTLIKEDSRLMWMGRLPEQIIQDMRYGLRAMANNKLFTSMAVLSLALGIGANTAIYSYVDAVLLRALPVRHPEDLVVLNWKAKGFPELVHNMSGSDYEAPDGYQVSPNFPFGAWEQLHGRQTSLESVFAFVGGGDLNVVIGNQARNEPDDYVSGGYFTGLGVPPAAGRMLDQDDDRFGASPVAVVSYDMWASRLASDPAAVGKTVLINSQPVTIVGVSAPGFWGVQPGRAARLFLPLHTKPLFRSRGTQKDAEATFSDGTYYWVEMMGRLRPGVAATRAQPELQGIFHQFVVSTAKNDKERANLPFVSLEPGGSGIDALRRQYSKPLYILMAMVLSILAIACANIANLLLSRATARRREMAVRLSLGASRGRVIRQLLTESVMLAAAGGLLGIGVAAAGIRFLNLLLSVGKSELITGATLDLRVLAFTMAVSLVTGILFGLVPAFAATKVDVTPALKESRAASRRSRFGVPFGLTNILMVGQIAISLLLVFSAGLFVRTLSNLHSVELGFNRNNVLLFSVNARKAGYNPAGLAEYYRQLQMRVISLPGVKGATMTTVPIVADWTDSSGIIVPGIPTGEGHQITGTSYMQVGPDFFRVMEIPILMGRPVDVRDTAAAPFVAVVNQVFAKKYFHGDNPVGRHFTMGRSEGRDIDIVGLARDARYHSLKQAIPPVAYLSWAQQRQANAPLDDLFFEVRTSDDPLRTVASVRRVVQELSPTIPVTDVSTQSDRIDGTIAQELTFARLCSCFAVLSLIIACVGLYGTMAYGVARRTGEIGIRVALGASRGRIGWLVMSEVLAMTGTGLAIGLLAAYESAHVVASFLFGTRPTDPAALTVSVLLLGIAALLAGYLPAWRASRIDPMAALRHE